MPKDLVSSRADISVLGGTIGCSNQRVYHVMVEKHEGCPNENTVSIEEMHTNLYVQLEDKAWFSTYVLENELKDGAFLFPT